MIIQIAAEQLLDTEPEHVPAGTSPGEQSDADHVSGATPSGELIGTANVPAGTSPAGPAPADDPSLASLSDDPIGIDHVPAGTSPGESAHTDHLAAAPPAGEPIGAEHVSAGTSPGEPTYTERQAAASPSGEPTRVEHVPAGTSPVGPAAGDGGSLAAQSDELARVAHAPAETSLRAGLCTIREIGDIEPETARRHLCTGTLLGAVVNAHGDVLALGRTRRLVSKAQRRALMVRDQTCQFPGCVSSRHLQAHHVIPWSSGGLTDLANLVLLCQFHHTCVHEGGIMISRNRGASFQGAAVGGESPWVFTLPDGQQVDRPGWQIPTARTLSYRLARLGSVDHVDRLNHPDAAAIQPKQYGEQFDLHAAVRVLFDLQIPSDAA